MKIDIFSLNHLENNKIIINELYLLSGISNDIIKTCSTIIINNNMITLEKEFLLLILYNINNKLINNNIVFQILNGIIDIENVESNKIYIHFIE